jgi:hypothetical protein
MLRAATTGADKKHIGDTMRPQDNNFSRHNKNKLLRDFRAVARSHAHQAELEISVQPQHVQDNDGAQWTRANRTMLHYGIEIAHAASLLTPEHGGPFSPEQMQKEVGFMAGGGATQFGVMRKAQDILFNWYPDPIRVRRTG